MQEIYFPLRRVLIIVIVLFLGFGFVLSHRSIVPFLAEKYLKDFGVEYSSIEGTLLHGVIIYDVKYEDTIAAKSLELHYNILNLLRPIPQISYVATQNLSIYVDNFPAHDANASDFFIPAFSVENLVAFETKIIVANENIALDIEAKSLSYWATLDVEKIKLKLSTVYADASMSGYIQENKFGGEGIFELDKSITSKYLGFIKSVPKKQKFKLEATLEGLKISTRFDTLQLSSDEALMLKNTDVRFEYLLGAKDFNLDVKDDFFYKEYAAKAKGKVWFDIYGNYKSELNIAGIKEPYGLGLGDVNAKISGDTKGIAVTLKNAKFDALIKSADYKKFDVIGGAKDFKLSFLQELPKNLQNENLSFGTKASVQIAPFSISGDLNVSSVYGSCNSLFTYDEHKALYELELFPNTAHDIYARVNVESFLPLKVKYISGEKTQKIEINANTLQAAFVKKESDIQGSGTLSGTQFHLTGNLETSEINIDSKISSLKKLVSKILRDSSIADDLYAARVDLHTHINYANKLKIQTELKIPLYVVQVDAHTSHMVENIAIDSSYEDGELVIEDYFLQYKKHDFYSKKASKIHLDKDFNILLEELWLYDTILIKGFINKESLEGNVSLTSEKFEYKGADADVRAKINLKASFSPKVQKIEGKITILDGLISYKPVVDHAIDDSDIIVIQDIKESSSSHLNINIQVDSAKPIAYKIKDVNLMVTPELTLFQEAGSEFKVLGVLTINEGDATFSGKKFEFDKSEIYFNGHKPINPQLNLNIHHHTIDYIDIEIYVTNTLEDPVIIFSSKPALSQNDIMSYILFGESASSMFDPTSDASKSSLLLAGGLKQLVNETSPIQVDTLNVLTNKEGTLGYEIGSRFNDKIRIVYKNDTASSLILQYSLSKSVRIEVDIRETGQGVSIIYVKDF